MSQGRRAFVLKRITSTGGMLVQKEGKSKIADTQTATFEYDGFNAVWQHRTSGTPVDPDYPWAARVTGFSTESCTIG